jgi:hypothetical protein
MRTASRLNSSLCIAAISDLLDGEYCSQKTGTKPVQVQEDAEEVVADALRDLADWLYRQLQREYDYLTSDAAIDEVIRANEYSFTVDGRRFG